MTDETNVNAGCGKAAAAVEAITTSSAAFDITTWAARATLCELLALSFRYPNKDLADAIASGQWSEAALELSQLLELDLPDEFETALSALSNELPQIVSDGTDALVHALRVEATHLFIPVPKTNVSPFEGIWRAKDNGVEPLLFVNPHSLEVERFCKDCGLANPEGVNEPLDHVATELELMQYLASLTAGVCEPVEGAPGIDDLPGGSPQQAFEDFVAEHPSVWMGRFAQAVVAETRASFYRAAALLLEAFIATL